MPGRKLASANTDGLGMVILNGPGLCARRKPLSWPVRRRVWRSRAPATSARLASAPPPGPRHWRVGCLGPEPPPSPGASPSPEERGPAAAGPAPLAGDVLGHEALYCLGQVALPGGAAQLAVRVDVDPHVPLQRERVEDCLILGRAQRLQVDPSSGVRGARLQQGRRPEQAANLVGAVWVRHPYLQRGPI